MPMGNERPQPSNDVDTIREAREAAIKVANELHTLNAYHQVIERRKHVIALKPKSSVQRRKRGGVVRVSHESRSLDNLSHVNAIDRGSARGIREQGDSLREETTNHNEQDNNSNVKYEMNRTSLEVDNETNHSRRRNSESESASNNETSKTSSNNHSLQNQQKDKKGWRGKLGRKRNAQRKDYSQFVSDDPSVIFSKSKKATKGASMCSYCGAIFSTKSYTSHHERICITKGIISMNNNNQGEMSPQIDVPMIGHINLSVAMKRFIIMTDDALIKVVRRSKLITLSKEKQHAERDLALMARDRAFYDMKAIRSLELQMQNTKKRKQRSGNKLWNKLQDKLAETYELIKEGDEDHNENVDKYKVRKADWEMKLDDDTLYVNVFVKQSAKLINNELERLFQQRWMINGQKEHKNNFELLRHNAHVQALRFVKFSLSADIQPEKIAVQLSNDLCRLLSPQLKSFGVEIETEIEYRKGPFFLLGVNIIAIDWIILLKHFHDEVSQRKNDWSLLVSLRGISIEDIEKEDEDKVEIAKWRFVLNSLFRMTRLEILEQVLAWMYHLSWIVSVPLCVFLYRYFLKGTVHRLILTAVTDDFFKYVEQKGMEMDLQVKHAKQQIAFMFEVLHQMRKDEQDLKKRKTEVEEGDSGNELRGPLLGPLNEGDEKEAIGVPDDLIPPNNLENVVFDSELPIGYRRLRKALLLESAFLEEAVYADALNYTQIKSDPWDKHDDLIGAIESDESVDENDFIGAKKNTEYLMPSSVFVKANMAYEEANLVAYNDHFFSVKKKTINPDVPYGRTFCAWTQITVYNNGCNSCRMVCSVEAEFPNGPPMVARSIKSAMRQGVSDVFLQLGETICRYASVTE